MRTSKARTGLRARLACHRRWSVYGKQLPSYTRGGSRMRESRPYGSVRGGAMKIASLPLRRREFICLFGAMAAAWSIAAYAQESATMPATSGTTASLPQIEVARVRPVDQVLPNVRLSDDVIDLMKAFSLSSAEGGIGGAWGAPLRPP